MAVLPARGEIWPADLDPTRSHEQAGERPVLIISTNAFNRGPAELICVLPITRTDRRVPLHVQVEPPEFVDLPISSPPPPGPRHRAFQPVALRGSGACG